MTFLPEFVWKKVWFDDGQSLLARCLGRSWCCIGCAVASPTWSPWARSGEASDAMRIARQIVGPMSALMWTFSMGHEHAAWAMTLGCARQILQVHQTGIIDYFSLTKRARGYLFDVQKVSFSVINMFALCIYFRVHVVLPLSGAKQIGGLDLKNHQWTPRVHCWQGVISLILFVHWAHGLISYISHKYQSSWRWLRTVMYGTCIYFVFLLFKGLLYNQGFGETCLTVLWKSLPPLAVLQTVLQKLFCGKACHPWLFSKLFFTSHKALRVPRYEKILAN